MPAVIKHETKYSPIQAFRRWSERILIDAAQEDLYRKYPGAAVHPRRRGRVRVAARLVFTTGFRLTPAPIRRRLMRAMLVRRGQDWDPA
ncbi:MAG: hypothetical protein Q7S35_02390 [Candidatus Limnocylindrales bacterium]|nr:hypothetical protein [Candidatus Limnocylindrales bacterium]